MIEQKVQDLRLRGRGFTLYPAANENGVDEHLMDSLITAIYSKLGAISEDYAKQEKVIKENPNILDKISKKDFSSNSGFKVEDLITNGLVTESGNDLVLTEKAALIISRAAAIQKELDEKGFRCCPCHNY